MGNPGQFGKGQNSQPRRVPHNPGDAWAHPLLGEWVKWQRSAHRSRMTIRQHAPVVQRFAEHVGVSPVSATEDDVMTWFDTHPEWSVGTARLYWTILSAWFKWLQRMGHRGDNPMIRLDSPPKQQNTPRPVSDEELQRLLSTRMKHKTKVMVLLAALAGLRCCEIAAVKGEDINLSGRLMYIKGKGGVIKTVPMHPMLVAAATTMPKSGWWFPTIVPDKNAPITPRGVSKTIGGAMTRAGIRGTAHCLRHWFGTTTLRASAGDLRTVQTLMRHASVVSTQAYTEIADDRRSEVVDMLDPFAAARHRFTESQGREF